MKRTAASLAVLLFLAWGRALADGKGSTGFNYLKIGAGARQMAMADCSVAVDGDVNSAAYNPASLADLAQQELGFLHTQYLEGIQYQYAAYAYPHYAAGTFGLAMHRVSYDDIQGYDAQNRKTSSLNASDTAVGLTYAKTVIEGLNLGLTGRYLKEDLGIAAAQGYSADAGAVYRLPGKSWWSKLAAGAAMRNLGTKPAFINEATALPLQYDLGVAYVDWGGRLIGTFEAHKPKDQKLGYSMGAEVTTRRFLSIRAGYKTDKDIGPNFTAGFGLLFWNESLRFDYAFVPYEDFGNVHRFGIVYRFGGIVIKHFRGGVKLMREGKFAEAILEFDKVLQKEPNHYMASRYMKLCAEKIKEEGVPHE